MSATCELLRGRDFNRCYGNVLELAFSREVVGVSPMILSLPSVLCRCPFYCGQVIDRCACSGSSCLNPFYDMFMTHLWKGENLRQFTSYIFLGGFNVLNMLIVPEAAFPYFFALLDRHLQLVLRINNCWVHQWHATLKAVLHSSVHFSTVLFSSCGSIMAVPWGIYAVIAKQKYTKMPFG